MYLPLEKGVSFHSNQSMELVHWICKRNGRILIRTYHLSPLTQLRQMEDAQRCVIQLNENEQVTKHYLLHVYALSIVN